MLRRNRMDVARPCKLCSPHSFNSCSALGPTIVSLGSTSLVTKVRVRPYMRARGLQLPFQERFVALACGSCSPCPMTVSSAIFCKLALHKQRLLHSTRPHQRTEVSTSVEQGMDLAATGATAGPRVNTKKGFACGAAHRYAAPARSAAAAASTCTACSLASSWARCSPSGWRDTSPSMRSSSEKK